MRILRYFITDQKTIPRAQNPYILNAYKGIKIINSKIKDIVSAFHTIFILKYLHGYT